VVLLGVPVRLKKEETAREKLGQVGVRYKMCGVSGKQMSIHSILLTICLGMAIMEVRSEKAEVLVQHCKLRPGRFFVGAEWGLCYKFRRWTSLNQDDKKD